MNGRERWCRKTAPRGWFCWRTDRRDSSHSCCRSATADEDARFGSSALVTRRDAGGWGGARCQLRTPSRDDARNGRRTCRAHDSADHARARSRFDPTRYRREDLCAAAISDRLCVERRVTARARDDRFDSARDRLRSETGTAREVPANGRGAARGSRALMFDGVPSESPRGAIALRMSPALRKMGLVAHVASSVGWLGAVVAFLVLSIAALSTNNADTARAAYVAMNVVGQFAIVPL